GRVPACFVFQPSGVCRSQLRTTYRPPAASPAAPTSILVSSRTFFHLPLILVLNTSSLRVGFLTPLFLARPASPSHFSLRSFNPRILNAFPLHSNDVQQIT